jgi:hypothetical protein
MNDAIPLWVCLALGFGLLLALGAVLYLAVSLPRRVRHLVLEAWTATAHAHLESATIKAEACVVVNGIVVDLRAHHREMAASVANVARTVRYLSALLDWFDALAHARYAPPGRDATTHLPGREAAASPAPPSPDASTVEPPGSAPTLSSDPAHRAAGLSGPNAAPMTKSGPPRLAPRSSGAPVRQPTMAGLGALDPAGDAGPPRPPLSRRPLDSAATLPSTVASIEPRMKQEPPVKVEEPPRRNAHRGGS